MEVSDDGVESSEVPTIFLADTLKLYSEPGVNPVIVIDFSKDLTLDILEIKCGIVDFNSFYLAKNIKSLNLIDTNIIIKIFIFYINIELPIILGTNYHSDGCLMG